MLCTLLHRIRLPVHPHLAASAVADRRTAAQASAADPHQLREVADLAAGQERVTDKRAIATCKCESHHSAKHQGHRIRRCCWMELPPTCRRCRQAGQGQAPRSKVRRQWYWTEVTGTCHGRQTPQLSLAGADSRAVSPELPVVVRIGPGGEAVEADLVVPRLGASGAGAVDGAALQGKAVHTHRRREGYVRVRPPNARRTVRRRP